MAEIKLNKQTQTRILLLCENKIIVKEVQILFISDHLRGIHYFGEVSGARRREEVFL